MKFKSLGIIALIVVGLLVYNLFCYGFANKMIDEDTHYVIKSYLENNLNITEDYEFIKAISNEDYTFSVYLKVKEEYYHVLLVKNQSYKVIDVDQRIPAYIK